MTSPPGAARHLPDVLFRWLVDTLRCQRRSGLVDVIGFRGVDSSPGTVWVGAGVPAWFGGGWSFVVDHSSLEHGRPRETPAVKKAPSIARALG